MQRVTTNAKKKFMGFSSESLPYDIAASEPSNSDFPSGTGTVSKFYETFTQMKNFAD